MRFKAVIFGAPRLITKSNNPFLVQLEKNINWYKYEDDLVPNIINTVKRSRSFTILMFLLKNSFLKNNIYFEIAENAYNTVKSVSYGDYIPGNKYYLTKWGQRKQYGFFKENGLFSINMVGQTMY